MNMFFFSLQLPCKHRCQKNCHSGDCMSKLECTKKVVTRCQCKRIKKEVHCNERSHKDNQLNCDDQCQLKIKTAQKKADETLEKRKLIEEMKQREELEYYQRKLEGKKRKPRKVKEVIETESFLKSKAVLLGTSLTMVVLSIFIYYLFSV